MNDRIRKADEFSRGQRSKREEQRAQIAASDPVQMPDSPRNDPSFKSEEFRITDRQHSMKPGHAGCAGQENCQEKVKLARLKAGAVVDEPFSTPEERQAREAMGRLDIKLNDAKRHLRDIGF